MELAPLVNNFSGVCFSILYIVLLYLVIELWWGGKIYNWLKD